MNIAAIVLTVALLLETLPSAAAGITRYGPGIARLDGLTRLGLTSGRHRWVVPALGVVHLAGSAAVIAGILKPDIGVAGGALEAAGAVPPTAGRRPGPRAGGVLAVHRYGAGRHRG